ncbi:hypothetical protein ACFPES_19040 [Paenibacillus sp. GCM10023248]|uniref:hypothetical protein n=1 Tax=unclassified Paenibacillus TaxID=185978 RepID=UPI00237846C5|nr:hypothetical protein [Paenibacillus sp. MAHUQ-63]MDD9269146.1 hypothetical protein [Paenibacillus sp. MAHUQ-63]
MSGGLNSNSSCYGAVYGTTYVSNASKLSIDVLYSHWGRGNYWHYAAVCTANGQCVTSNDDYWGGLGEIDVSGYSGTVSFILELSSDGIGFGGAELGLQNLTAQ